MLRFFRPVLICIYLCLFSSLFASIAVYQPENMDIPSKRSFVVTTDLIRPFEYQKIKAFEYVTDPLIMYVALWGCIGLTLSVSERMPGDWYTGDNIDIYNGWSPINTEITWQLDDKASSPFINKTPGEVFLERMKMDPFASGFRFDSVFKSHNGMTVFKGTFWAKNFIEPTYFTMLALYMRSKNYHPALLILEMIGLSALYEFTIRPFFMRASFEQFLKNPLVAIVFGLFMDELSTFLLTTPYKGLHVLAYIINPFNALPVARAHGLLFFDPYRRKASIEAIIKL